MRHTLSRYLMTLLCMLAAGACVLPASAIMRTTRRAEATPLVAAATGSSERSAVVAVLLAAAVSPPVNPPRPPNPPERWFGDDGQGVGAPPGGGGGGGSGDDSSSGGGLPLPHDCNQNGVPDLIEPSPDCDGDGVSDWCQIVEDPLLDCDGNDVLDLCEIGLPGGEADCDGNGVLDACQPEFQLGGGASDCDGNGVADALDICRNPGLDCDRDGALDSCQWQGGEGDCDGNGVPDACEIGDDPTRDCDGNGVLDMCEHGGCGIGFEDGPLYLGDGDWGRWGFVLPPDCGQPKFSVDYGPVDFMLWDGQHAHFMAHQLSPSQGPVLAQLRVTTSCNGCECTETVQVTVQAYSHIKVEARAFIPCEAVGLLLPSLDELVFGGDCRGFSCEESGLPTNGLTPSSRVIAGLGCSLRLEPLAAGWSAPWSVTRPTREAAAWIQQHPSQSLVCNGEAVPVASTGSQCLYDVVSWDPDCLPAGINPTPTAVDRSTCAGTAPGVLYVGAPRYKQIKLELAAANSCITSPDINLEVDVWFWQRCDPMTGMENARVDFSGAHDLFPAYELVVQEERPADVRRGCLYTCPPIGGPADLAAGPGSFNFLPRITFGPPPMHASHLITGCPQSVPTALYWKPLSAYFD